MTRKITFSSLSLAGAAVLVMLCLQQSWAYPKWVMIGEPLGSDEISRSIAMMAPSISDKDLSLRLTGQYRTAVSKTDWAKIFDTDHIVCIPLPSSEDFCSTIYFDDIESGTMFLKITKRTTWLVSILAARLRDEHQILTIQVKRNPDFPPASDVVQQKGTYSSSGLLDKLNTMEAGDSFYRDPIGRVLGKQANLMSDEALYNFMRSSLNGRLSGDSFAVLSNNPGQCLQADPVKWMCSLLYYHDLKPDFLFSRVLRGYYLVMMSFQVSKGDLLIESIKVSETGGFLNSDGLSQKERINR